MPVVVLDDAELAIQQAPQVAVPVPSVQHEHELGDGV